MENIAILCDSVATTITLSFTRNARELTLKNVKEMTERTKELRSEKEEKIWEFRSKLIQLLIGLGMSEVRIAGTIAIIAAYHLEDEMVSWVATFKGRSDDMTIQVFMAKLRELTGEDV